MVKRILMIGWELPPHNSGGLGEACFHMLEEFDLLTNIHITFVLPVFGPEVEYAKFSNVEIIQVPLHEFAYKSTFDYSGNGSSLDLVFLTTFFAEKVLEIFKFSKFDLIHAHDWLTYTVAEVLSEKLKIPLICHVHATQFDHAGGNFGNSNIHTIEKRVLEKSNRVIAVSNRTKDILIKEYSIEPNKISVVYNGIRQMQSSTDAHFSYSFINHLKSQNKKIILFMGRLTLMKNPIGFLQAANLAKKHNPDLVFIFAGKGDQEYELIELVASLRLSDFVFFAGFVRGDVRDMLFSVADLFVMPSISEPFGLVALEAALRNTPVLLTHQSGVSEIFKNRLITNFWDIEDMANKILLAVKYPYLAQVLSHNAYLEANEISWTKAVEQIQNIYNSL